MIALDEDVLAEQKRVEATSENKLAVKAFNLKKTYGDTLAVNNICFGLEFGD